MWLNFRLYLRSRVPVYALCALTPLAAAQNSAPTPLQGSVVQGRATGQVLPLSMDEAIRMGLHNNLAGIAQSADVETAGGQHLQQLQSLLPTITGTAQEAVSQVNLQAEGLRVPGFPAVIGPFGYSDFRATLKQTLLSVSSIQNFIASRHLLTASRLSQANTADLIVLAVGNAYMLCLADAARVSSVEAQVKTSKVSLGQAVLNHQNGVSPRLDELRARVDYQTQEQSLIAAQNDYQKDKIALARAIGLPLTQRFTLSDETPFAKIGAPDFQQAMKDAEQNRSDLKAAEQQVMAAERSLRAAHAERYPELTAEADYGEIGVNPANSYATLDATGKVSGPIFEEGKLRGDAKVASAQLAQARAQYNNLQGQVRADVKDSILDIEAAEELVSVARSNVSLANEALSEAQQRFQAGVSDNLAVSQAQSAVADASNRYVSSLYQYNVARLSLARATGVARLKYKTYLEGQ